MTTSCVKLSEQNWVIDESQWFLLYCHILHIAQYKIQNAINFVAVKQMVFTKETPQYLDQASMF